MSNYTQEQQTEIIKDAMMLTNAVQTCEQELLKQKAEKFKLKPAAPTRKVLEIPNIQPQIPEAPKITYSTYLLSLPKKLLSLPKKISDFFQKNFKLYIPTSIITITIICLIILAVIISSVSSHMNILFTLGLPLYIFLYISTLVYIFGKKGLNRKLAKSPEYLKSVEEAIKAAKEKQQKVKEDIAKQQAEIDTKYQSDLEYYNTVTLPNHNKELNAWEITQKIKITMLEEELQLNKDTLEALYDSTHLIPHSYKTLEFLCWLYDDMRTSDHEIDRAIDLLNEKLKIKQNDKLNEEMRNMGRRISSAIDDMHSSMMYGFNAVYDAIEEGNEELVKIRRDQNLANIAEIIQRYNLNKMVKLHK